VYIHDLCIGDRKNVLPITVADIDRILVNGPHFVSSKVGMKQFSIIGFYFVGTRE
jgi:hypothetical protein